MHRAAARKHQRQAKDYRHRLLEKRAEVLSGLGAKFDTLASMGRVAEEDQAPISHDEFITLQVNSIDYEQLRLIDAALERLRAGDFGICTACGEPISQKRLEALPWARYCIRCQEEIHAARAYGDIEFAANSETPAYS